MKTMGIDIVQQQPPCALLKDEGIKIMSQGNMPRSGSERAGVRIERGMVVISCEGDEVGRVAALAVRIATGQVECVILGHLPNQARYQSLPHAWVEQVIEQAVVLNVPAATIAALPDWHPS